MRLDKFLKVSRVIKRRTVAKQACEGGRVTINGKSGKAASEVEAGAVVTVSFGERFLKFKVLEVKAAVPAARAKELYEVLEERGFEKGGSDQD
jgi:ribosomal 50S subunit-recycling heat shock protein